MFASSPIGHKLTQDRCPRERMIFSAQNHSLHLSVEVSIQRYDMITYDSAAPMRIVLSFLMSSPENLLVHHLGSDSERRRTLNKPQGEETG